jgi:hypothetical protein
MLSGRSDSPLGDDLAAPVRESVAKSSSRSLGLLTIFKPSSNTKGPDNPGLYMKAVNMTAAENDKKTSNF